MRELPNEIRDFQEKSKTATIDKVQTAITDLQAEGFIVTRKLLLERTGLSNSVLSKQHIKDVLKDNRVCQYAVKKKIKTESDKDILVELNNANKKIESLEEKVKDLESKLNKEKVEYYKMKEANEILRGELHLLKQKAKLKGIVLE